MEEKLERQKGVGYTSKEDPVWIDQRDLALSFTRPEERIAGAQQHWTLGKCALGEAHPTII